MLKESFVEFTCLSKKFVSLTLVKACLLVEVMNSCLVLNKQCKAQERRMDSEEEVEDLSQGMSGRGEMMNVGRDEKLGGQMENYIAMNAKRGQ
jgi:hypothetical protein